MARTVVAYSPLVPNSSLSNPAGTAVDQANGMTIAKAKPELTVLRVANTDGAPHNVIVRAGVNPPDIAASLGDLTVSVPATTGVVFLGPFESGRFVQKDGSLSIDFAASFAGTITAFSIPRNT
jgi:hypothetical protein